MQNQVIYEQPLNERVRTFLRLEFLFKEAGERLEGTSQWDSRGTLSSILDILNIFTRQDLKTDVLKELERQMATLSALEKSPGVDRHTLGRLLDELDLLIDRMHAMQGQVGQELRLNEFLNSIKQRSSIPGGTCDFDLPAYHFWLQRPAEQRIRALQHWFKAFEPIQLSIQLILRLIRESTHPRREHAAGGFYQRALDPNTPCQLVRVFLDYEVPYFAEISGGRHRFTVRFLQFDTEGRNVQTNDDVAFHISCCVI